MPLELREKCVEELRASLAEQLKDVEVHNGTFVSMESLDGIKKTEELLPQGGELRKRMASMLGDSPLVEFIWGTLMRELADGHDFSSTAGKAALSSLPEYHDLTALADRLVAGFCALPYKYTLTTKLPVSLRSLTMKEGTYALSDTVRLQRGSGAIQFKYSLISGIKKRDRLIAGTDNALLNILNDEFKPAAWDQEAVYLQVDVDGFNAKYSSGETYDSGVALIRSFYGLAIATHVFQPKRWPPSPSKGQKVFIHRLTRNGFVVEDASELNSQTSATISSIQTVEDEGSHSQGAQVVWFDQAFLLIATVFGAGKKARRVLLAAQWLFDSYAGADELLRFIQAAVVIEILLGEEEKADAIGLSSLLANRCAYLIAESDSERTKLLSDFKKIYDVRSRIVHQGKSRLSPDERVMFERLRAIGMRLLFKEMAMLAKDVNKPPK